MKSPRAVLAHRLEGEGETVLLLNGGFMTFASWEPVAEHLRRGYRLLRCDLRGQLRSPGASPGQLADHVKDVEGLLDQVNVEAVHVLGTSFGAWVGLRLAAALPERVLSVIAATAGDVATPAIVQGVEDLRAAVRSILEGGDPGQLHDLLVEEVYSAGFVSAHRDELALRRRQMEQLPRSWFEGLDGILSCTENLDVRPHLAEVRCPTLVIHAAEDRLIPGERSRALAAAIADAELVEHSSSGHALVAEDPDWLARQCLGFLSRVAVGRPSVE